MDDLVSRRRARRFIAAWASTLAIGCGGAVGAGVDGGVPLDGGIASDGGAVADGGGCADGGACPGPGRGFPASAPWLSFYGTAAEMGDLSRVASRFRIINIDVDPGDDPAGSNFTDAQIATLRAEGANRVISYFNLGSCETTRTYWNRVPAGFVSCAANRAAQLGPYAGYPDETWMDLGNADYQHLILDHVAPRLVARGIDGFFFDNLELVEHGPSASNGPCPESCARGGLELVHRLRAKYPRLLFVMQNGTGDATRTASVFGVPFPSLLDGISHEEVYAPLYDAHAESELRAWKTLGAAPGGRPFWIATEDYVGDCGNSSGARAAFERSRGEGFSPYATNESGGQRVVCWWDF